jgi:hypothetical protein
MKTNVITLCGSTKFKNEYLEVNKWLTLQGNIVIATGLYGQADGDKLKREEKIMLDKLHKDKIDISDEIFVIDVNGYVGNSTKGEMEHADFKGKKIRFYTKEKDDFELWKHEYYSRTEEFDWNL